MNGVLHTRLSRFGLTFKGVIPVLLGILFLLPGCKEEQEPANALFEALGSEVTGIDFINKLTPTPEFNMFNYMYFYNGAGVGTGDFNNDGLACLPCESKDPDDNKAEAAGTPQ